MSYDPDYPYCEDCGEDVHREALRDSFGEFVRDEHGLVVFRRLACPFLAEFDDELYI